MIFNEVVGLTEKEINSCKLIQREAVRGVIIQNGKLLMVHSNKGDYKLPGGGVEQKEAHEDALVREIAEETGCSGCTMQDKIGVVTERHIDRHEQDAVFQMNSHYYLCDWAGEVSEQQLDGYEAKQNFTPVWLTIDAAITQNEKILKHNERNGWIERENVVLNKLKRSLISS
ncbi:NUDIX hydrolase [Halobacillus litoralis]|uniref:NUDIX hydrolase n=1 Tax=Halobacillus litoralis TaxID=45668 RepID=UPI002491938B|nr:NUDIX domain-containing protein [Halobacillus litoralis]